MIAILSPAKTMDYESQRDMPASTTPRLLAEANELATAAASLTEADLMRIMHISQALAELNHGRFNGFPDLPLRPAIQAFDGDVYTGLDAKSLDMDGIAFAQDHLRILSGLYGILRPLDEMKPYRLEMGTKWSPAGCKLTTWWQGRVADLLSADAVATGRGAVLNLASKEYWAVAKGRLPADVRVVDVEFLAADGRFITMHAKTARGVMARWMIENRIVNINDMRGFDAAGYAFDADVSTDDSWTFRRADDQVGPPLWN